MGDVLTVQRQPPIEITVHHDAQMFRESSITSC